MSIPVAPDFRQLDTHRLVPSKYGIGGESVLAQIADDDSHLQGIFALDHATNNRLLAENGKLPDIGPDELVAGIPQHHIVNAAFTHHHPLGNRFNGADRGAWYAGFELDTSQAEVAWHKSLELGEIEWTEESVTYDDYLADFSGEYHDIRGDAAYAKYLDPDSYVESQKLAEALLADGSLGIIYPSVRHADGVCLACFRPALVNNVRKSARYRFTWSKAARTKIEKEEDYI